MLAHLVLCSASALVASGDSIDYGTAPLHLDDMGADISEQHRDYSPMHGDYKVADEGFADHLMGLKQVPLEDFAKTLEDPNHSKALRDQLLGLHQQVADQLDVPPVPAGDNHAARLKAVMQAFKGDDDDATEGEAAQEPAPQDDDDHKGYPKELRPKDSRSPDEKKKDALTGHEAEALAKIGKSLKTMVLMHVMMQPMLQKLTEVAAHVEGPARDAAVSTLQHLAALDLYSKKAGEMLAVIQKAEQGDQEEQDKAIKLLEVGLLMIKGGMHKHMMALKKLKESHAAPPSDSMGINNAITGKLNAVVVQMQEKVDAELADPARKDDPLVGLDVQMLESMKKAVSKSEALVAAAEEGMKKE